MKIEIEVRAFGKQEVQGTAEAFKSTELMRVHELPGDTTLAQVQAILAALFHEVESGYANPEQCWLKSRFAQRKKMAKLDF
ncbi:hypothetical protein [Paenibacillus sp. GCM10023250]|uniref:hypothetical protein n=1 Tax=Paenibacillus sp. GCM10023250 TaxID=3252648 RepID=UPI00360B8F44